MKNIFKTFCVALVLTVLATPAFAQPFNSAIGLRAGYPAAISYKQYLTESNAFEVYGGFYGFSSFYTALSVSAAYLVHRPIEGVDNLEWYFGGGGTAVFWTYRNTVSGDFPAISFGVQGYLGLQYTFNELPLSITLDWVPTLNLTGGLYSGFNRFGGGYGGFGIRYVLGN